MLDVLPVALGRLSEAERRCGDPEKAYALGREAADRLARPFVDLDRRIEVLTPVRDRKLVARLLEVLDLALADDTNSWELGPDGWRRVPTVRSLSLQEQLKEMAVARVRRRRDIELRVQPTAPGS